MGKSIKKVKVTCYSADGTLLKVNPETGKFDPPFGPPKELQIELLKYLNLELYGVRVKPIETE